MFFALLSGGLALFDGNFLMRNILCSVIGYHLALGSGMALYYHRNRKGALLKTLLVILLLLTFLGASVILMSLLLSLQSK